jgi:ADP-ribose pyrophosphatase YjhB (NUDIX family)
VRDISGPGAPVRGARRAKAVFGGGMGIDQSWYVRPAGVAEHISCGGVIARKDASAVLVALITEPGLSGYVLPKGHLEPGEDLEQAARREIVEEAGIADLVLVCKLGVKERLDFKKRAWKVTHYYLFTTSQSVCVPTDPKHQYSVGWFPLNALPPMFWPEQRDLVEQSSQQITRACVA